MNNPLLQLSHLPEFSDIKPEHIVPAIEAILTNNRQEINHVLSQNNTLTWQNLMQPLEELEEHISLVWSAIGHLNATVNSPEIREAYEACLPKLSAYTTELGHNRVLFERTKQLYEEGKGQLTAPQKKALKDVLRDFHLAGVDLADADKKEYAKLQESLSQLTTTFENNVLDATNGWSRLVENEKTLSGLPELAIASAKQRATAKELDGWLFSLDMPSYIAVMSYADDRALREEMHMAFITRASDVGTNAGKWDKSQVMRDILKTRESVAKLLGFSNFAQLSLAKKMADTPDEVLGFLNDLVKKSRKKAEQDIEELTAFEKEQGCDELKPWDVAY